MNDTANLLSYKIEWSRPRLEWSRPRLAESEDVVSGYLPLGRVTPGSDRDHLP